MGDVLAYPLPRITNLSVKLSVLPEEYKIEKLTPLFKKDSKPISTSSFSVQNY